MGEFKFYLAPMLDVTTPHFRRFLRTINKEVILFTEMIVAETVLHTSDEKLKEIIGFFDDKTIVQIGGSNPLNIAAAITKVHTIFGYKDFNLNCGCPSSKVKKGNFGASLMLMPQVVIDIINEVYEKTGFIMSLKIRIGVDENDSYIFFKNFIEEIVSRTMCKTFFVHARKCWLSGLSPLQNRTIPCLNYDFVYKIKDEYPNCNFILNGGISSPEQLNLKRNLDGFMIGRAAIKDPFIFDKFIEMYRNNISKAIEIDYICRNLIEYFKSYGSDTLVRHHHIFPLLNIFHGRNGTKKFKNFLVETVQKKINFDGFVEMIEEYFLAKN